MNDLDDLVYNPQTGLFENKKDPTAHLSAREQRQQRRKQRESDPQRMAMKPRINFFRRSGDVRPLVGEQIALAWNVSQAQSVNITFPDKRTVSFSPIDNCLFTLPKEECQVRLVAINGNYRTQSTMKIKPRSKFPLVALKYISDWLKQIRGMINFSILPL